MPKIGSIVSAETPSDYIVVNSSAYGRHLRARRGSRTPLVITEAMKKAGELTRAANQIAKVINDAFKPFCSDIRDGTRWSRLVGLFKSQLHKYGTVYMNTLRDDFYFHRRRPLVRVLSHTLHVSPGDGNESLILKVSSESLANLRTHVADRYELIIITVFLDADFHATVATDTSLHDIRPVTLREHTAEFQIPPGARAAIVALKCTHRLVDTVRAPGTGMSVVEVLDLPLTGT